MASRSSSSSSSATSPCTASVARWVAMIVGAVDRLRDLRLERNRRFNARVEEQREIVDRIGIQRVRDNDQDRVALLNRQDRVQFAKRDRADESARRNAVDADLFDEPHLELNGQGLRDILASMSSRSTRISPMRSVSPVPLCIERVADGLRAWRDKAPPDPHRADVQRGAQLLHPRPSSGRSKSRPRDPRSLGVESVTAPRSSISIMVHPSDLAEAV